MFRLVILAVAVVSSSNAGRVNYNYNRNQFQENSVEQSKSFYFFSAPEDYSSQRQATVNYRILPSIRTNHQHIVIKAPEYNNYNNIATRLVQQAPETKTHIYLLSKEPDTADLERRFQEIQRSVQSPPEVRFIKYRTPEEAQLIQQQIKSQYDNLPGSHRNVNSVVVPISGFSQSTAVAAKTKDDDDDIYTARNPPFLPTGVDVVPGSSYLPPQRD